MTKRKGSIARVFFFLIASLAASASAQELPDPAWKKSFDEVEVETIKPIDLPAPEESRFPTSLQSTDVLPRAPSLDALRATSSRVSDRVVEVIAVVRPKVGFATKPLYLRGHGVWISERDGASEPILVTPLHWVKGAERVLVVPSAKRRAGQATQVPRRSIANLHGDVESLAKSGDAVPVRLDRPDEHRNLVTLTAPPDDLTPPDEGLRFFDYEGQSPTRVYGYSPAANHALVETRFIEPNARRDEIVFYLQSSYPVILGAPLLTDGGEVVGITAMRHPEDQERTLVVPPGALRRYVRHAQGLDDDDDS